MVNNQAMCAQVLKNESERKSAEEWFSALDPRRIPLLAVLPNGEICVCWNTSYTDHAYSEASSPEPPMDQRHCVHDNASVQRDADSNPNSNGSVRVELIDESSRQPTSQSSAEAHNLSTAARCSPSDAASPASSSIFLNLPLSDGGHASDASGTRGGPRPRASDGGAWSAEAGSYQELNVPVHQAARTMRSPPPVGETDARSFWSWTTPFSDVQRALSSMWIDSATQSSTCKRAGTIPSHLHASVLLAFCSSPFLCCVVASHAFGSFQKLSECCMARCRPLQQLWRRIMWLLPALSLESQHRARHCGAGRCCSVSPCRCLLVLVSNYSDACTQTSE